MAEKYELSSAKSSGISFTRMLYPGFIVALLVFSFSIVASNYLKPRASEGFHKKIRNMKTNKLTFVFDEKIFNRDFKDYSIRIGKKYEDGRSVDDVLIYDHTDADNSVMNMIRAKSGQMYTTRDMRFLIMDLNDGYHIKEIRAESADRIRNRYNEYARPVMRFSFSKLRKTFDLAEMLDLNVVNISYKEHDMMGAGALLNASDSIKREIRELLDDSVYDFVLFRELQIMEDVDERTNQLSEEQDAADESAFQSKFNKTANKVPARKKTVRRTSIPSPVKIFPERLTDQTKSILEIIESDKIGEMKEEISKRNISWRTNHRNTKQEIRIKEAKRNKFLFKLHQIYSYATVCLLFLFIGAPAGAIVRKGGFGYPVLIAIGFYLTFIMSSILGEKLVGSGTFSAELGAWIPCLILFPFAIYFSWRALHDNKPILRPFIERIRNFKKGL